MYVSGQHNTDAKTQIESGTFSFVAADRTLYKELWQIESVRYYRGKFIQQAVVEMSDAWRNSATQKEFPTIVKFTLFSGSASYLFSENVDIDLELSSIKSVLPWGDIAGKEIIAYF